MLLVAMCRLEAAGADMAEMGEVPDGGVRAWVSKLRVRLMCTYSPPSPSPTAAAAAWPAVGLSQHCRSCAAGRSGLPVREMPLLQMLLLMVLLLLVLWCRTLCFIARASLSSLHAIEAGRHCIISTAAAEGDVQGAPDAE